MCMTLPVILNIFYLQIQKSRSIFSGTLISIPVYHISFQISDLYIYLYSFNISSAFCFISCRRLSGRSTSILFPWLNSHMTIPFPYTSALIVYSWSFFHIKIAQ